MLVTQIQTLFSLPLSNNSYKKITLNYHSPLSLNFIVLIKIKRYVNITTVNSTAISICIIRNLSPKNNIPLISLNA